MKVEPVITKFYDFLKEGKLMGLKCEKCGGVTFPPKLSCIHCGSRDLKWTEISGNGKLILASTSSLPAKRFADYAPYVYGLVELNEGSYMCTLIEGVEPKPDSLKEVFEKLPLKVKAEIKEMAGLHIVVFRVLE